MKRRQGFTLVELMVSMALIIFIMAILSQAFIAALGVFRNLKAQGDLAEKLRATAQILQHDLAADHFGSNRRLSDPTFWNNGPPQQGFFQVVHPTNSSAFSLINPIEGHDINNNYFYRSTDHRMSFTVRLVGNDMGDFMSASAIGSGNTIPSILPLPLGIGSIQTFGPLESRYQSPVSIPNVTGYNSQWAAVAWFMEKSNNETTVTDPTSGVVTGTQLYTLYRRQVLLVPDNGLVALSTTPSGGVPSTVVGGGGIGLINYLEMSCFVDPKTPNYIYFNNPRDITMPYNRALSWGGSAPYTPISTSNPLSPLAGSDIQLNDVISFDVRLLPLYPLLPPPPWTPPIDPFVNLWDPFFTPGLYFNYNGLPGRVFDTWSSYSGTIDYSTTWSTPNNPATSIPWWTTNPMTYQFPVGSTRTITLPGGGANSIVPGFGSGPIIRAIQVTIRIWDYKTNQTRQVTIVQAM